MTRIRISLGILAVLIGVSVFSGVWVSRGCRELLTLTDSIGQCLENGEVPGAVRASAELEEQWEGFRRGASVLLKNSRLTEIDRICARITELSAAGSEETAAELCELEHMLRTLRNGEIPRLTTIF